MSEGGIISIVFLIVLGAIYISLIVSNKRTKTKTTKYTNINYRIKYESIDLLNIKWRYIGEIYTIIPFTEKILMRTGPFLEKNEAIKETELVVNELKKNLS